MKVQVTDILSDDMEDGVGWFQEKYHDYYLR